MRKSRKYRPKGFTYGVSGRLEGSRCSHIVPVTRERAAELIRRHGEPINDSPWRRAGSREWSLPFTITKELHAGYRYADIRVYIVRG